MNHRLIIACLCLATAASIVGGVVHWKSPDRFTRALWLGDQRLNAPLTTPELIGTATDSVMALLPTVGPPAAEAQQGVAAGTPSVIAMNEATDVTVTVQITDARLIAGSVNLQRLDASGRVTAVLGALNDAGTGGDAVAGDRQFTVRRSFTEATMTPVRLRASWALRGVLQRSVSNTATIDVWQRLSGLPLLILYPPEFAARQVVLDLPLITSAARLERDTGGSGVTIATYSNSEQLSPRQWFVTHLAGRDVTGLFGEPLALESYVIEDVIVGGRPATRVTLNYLEFIYVDVFVAAADSIVGISTDFTEDGSASPFFERIVESLRP